MLTRRAVVNEPGSLRSAYFNGAVQSSQFPKFLKDFPSGDEGLTQRIFSLGRSCPLSPLSVTNSVEIISLVCLLSLILPSSIAVKEGEWLGSA